MNCFEFSDFAINIWGWILIAPIAFSLVATWIIILPNTIQELKTIIAEFFTKRPRKANKEKTKKGRGGRMKIKETKKNEKVKIAQERLKTKLKEKRETSIPKPKERANQTQ